MSTSRPGSTKGKIAGTKAGLTWCLKSLLQNSSIVAKRSAKVTFFVDVEAFDLVEEDVGSGADGLIAVDGAGSDDADGGFVGLHDAELGVGGVGAEEHVGSDVKGVLHVAGRMVGGKVEPFEVVVVGVDVGAVLDGKSHAGKDVDDLIEHESDGVFAAEVSASAGKGDVDFFFVEALGHVQLEESLCKASSQSWAISSLSVVDLFS